MCLRSVLYLFFRIVEKGYYSERDAADAVKQILEAVAVSKIATMCVYLLVLASYKRHQEVPVWGEL